MQRIRHEILQRLPVLGRMRLGFTKQCIRDVDGRFHGTHITIFTGDEPILYSEDALGAIARKRPAWPTGVAGPSSPARVPVLKNIGKV